MTVKIIGKKASKAVKAIKTEAGIKGYIGKSKIATDAIVNYGLASPQLEAFFKRYPSARKVPIVNRHVGYSKYNVVRRAGEKKIPVPESKLSLGKLDKKAKYIEKKTASIGGKGIIRARGKGSISGKNT